MGKKINLKTYKNGEKNETEKADQKANNLNRIYLSLQ